MNIRSQSVFGRFLTNPYHPEKKRVIITLCNAFPFFLHLLVCWALFLGGRVLGYISEKVHELFCWYFDLEPDEESNSLVPRGKKYIFLDEFRVTPAFWSVLIVYALGGLAFLQGDYSDGNAAATSVANMPSIWWFPAMLFALSTAFGLFFGGILAVFMAILCTVLGIFWCLFKLWECSEPLREKASASALVLSEKTASFRRGICQRCSVDIDLK
jgi:hypothetical protein